MGSNDTGAVPPRSYWVIAIVALLWNLVGVMTFVMHKTMTPEDFAAMAEAERQLYANAPGWYTIAYATAVFGGALGCVGLLLRKAWALPVFVVSLAGILLQFGYDLLFTSLIEIKGAAVIIGPALVITIGLLLIWHAYNAKSRGLLS